MAEISALDEAKRKRERDLAAEVINDDDKESQSGGDSDPESLPNKKPKQTDEEPLSPRRKSSPKTISSVSRLRKDLSEMKTQDPSVSSTEIPKPHDSNPSTPSSSGDIQEDSPQGDPIQEDPMQADNKRKERDMTPTTEAEVLNSSSPSKRRSWRPHGLGGSNGADHIAEQDVTMVEAKLPTNPVNSNPFLNPTSPSYDPSWDVPVEDDTPAAPKSSSKPLTKPMPTFGATSTFGTSSQGSFLQSSFQSSSERGFGGFGRTASSEPTTTTTTTTTTSSFATPSPFGALAATTSPFGALAASTTSPFGALVSSSSPFSALKASSSSFLDEQGGTEGFGTPLKKGKGKEKKAEEEEGDGGDDDEPDEEPGDEGESSCGDGDGDGDGGGDGDGDVTKEAVTGVFGSVRELPAGIEVSTGEEGEINLLQIKGKLHVMDHAAKQWKERGTGNLRLNISDDHTQVRLVMRADAVLRVILNVLLKPDILALSLEDKYVRFAAVENAHVRVFAFKVGQRDGARQLFKKINSALEEAEEARVLERIRQDTTSDKSTSDKANSAESGFGKSRHDAHNRNEPLRKQSNTSESDPSEQNTNRPKLNDHQPSAESAGTTARS